jgi:hypothetical protein
MQLSVKFSSKSFPGKIYFYLLTSIHYLLFFQNPSPQFSVNP